MNNRIPANLISTFLSLEGALYAMFLVLDLTGQGGQTIPIKYGGILLCLAFSLLCAQRGGDGLVPAALALTACAAPGRGALIPSGPGWPWGRGLDCTPLASPPR